MALKEVKEGWEALGQAGEDPVGQLELISNASPCLGPAGSDAPQGWSQVPLGSVLHKKSPLQITANANSAAG